MIAPEENRAKYNDQEVSLTRYSWLIVGIAMLAFAATSVTRVAWSCAIPIAAPELKLSMAQAGALMSAFYFGSVPVSFLSGVFIDRFGPKLILTASMIVTGGFAFLFQAAGDYGMLFATRVLIGIGAGAVFASGTKYVLAWFPNSTRTTAMGIFITGPSVGILIATGLLPSVIQAQGWQTAFIHTGIGTLAIGVIVFLFGKEKAIAENSAFKAAPETKKETAAETLSEKWKQFSSGVLKRSFVIGCIVYFLSMGGSVGFTTWIIGFLMETHGFSLAVAGGTLAASSLAALLGPAIAGILSDIFKTRKAICLAGAIGTSATIIILAMANNAFIIWVFMLLKGFIPRFLNTPLSAWQAGSVARDRAGTAMGFFQGIGQIGALVYPVALGWLLDITSRNYFAVVMAVAAAYGLAGLLLLFMEEKKDVGLEKGETLTQ